MGSTACSHWRSVRSACHCGSVHIRTSSVSVKQKSCVGTRDVPAKEGLVVPADKIPVVADLDAVT